MRRIWSVGLIVSMSLLSVCHYALAQNREIVSPPPQVVAPVVRLTNIQCHLKNIRALTVTGSAQNISAHELKGVQVNAMIGTDESSIIYDTSLYPKLRIGNLAAGESVRFKIATAGPSVIDPNSAAAKNYFKGCDVWAADRRGLDISYHVAGR